MISARLTYDGGHFSDRYAASLHAHLEHIELYVPPLTSTILKRWYFTTAASLVSPSNAPSVDGDGSRRESEA